MADTPTLEDYENGKLDLNSIGDMSNGAADLNGTGLVTTRTGQTYRTMKKIEADAQSDVDGITTATQTSVDTLLAETEADLTAITTAAQGDRDAIGTLRTNSQTDRDAIGTLKANGQTDRDAIGVLLAQATTDAAATNTKRIETEGYATSAAAALASMGKVRYGSVLFPDENGYRTNPETCTDIRLATTSNLSAASGSGVLFSGDSSIMVLLTMPQDMLAGRNHTQYVFGNGIGSGGSFGLRFSTLGQFDNPTNTVFTFFAAGTGNTGPFTVSSGGLARSTRQCAVFIRIDQANNTVQVDLLDIDTGVWVNGTPAALPAAFVGITAAGLVNPLTFGLPGTVASYFDYRASGLNNSLYYQGGIGDFLIADKLMTQADVESIVYSGTDPVTLVTAPLTRLYAPFVDSNGNVTLAVTSNRPAINYPLTLNGTLYAGATIKRQGATYNRLDPVKFPCFIGREANANSATYEMTGTTAGVSGRLFYRVVGRSGRVYRDWARGGHTFSGSVYTFKAVIPTPINERFQVQTYFSSHPALISCTHSFVLAGPVIHLWSQSEGYYSTFMGASVSGGESAIAVQPEGDTSNIIWVYTGDAKAPIPRYGYYGPGFIGDNLMNMNNYILRRTQEPVCVIGHTISGTSLGDLMNDSINTGNDWNTLMPVSSGWVANRGNRGEYIATGHVKIGWEAADNIIAYMENVGAAWYRGTGYPNGNPYQQIDHFLYNGEHSQTAASVELPCNRFVPVNTYAVTDANNEADQRDNQRNFGHILGYKIGPPQTTHKMENENSTGNIAGTHPEAVDWEGALEMSFANAEAMLLSIDLGNYPGAVFFETIRAGTASNKVIVTAGDPNPYPGLGLPNPTSGYFINPGELIAASATQGTSITTAVTCNADIGTITTQAATVAAGAEAEFVINNSRIRAGDTVSCEFVTHPSAGAFMARVKSVAAGQCTILLTNLHASTTGAGAAVIEIRVNRAERRGLRHRRVATNPSPVRLRTKKAGGNPKWGFEARITAAGSWSLLNVTAAAILNYREVELTLSADYIVGETAIRYHPGSPGAYGGASASPPVSQEDWRSGALFFTGSSWVAGKEPGWAVSGSNQALVLTT